MGDPETLWRMVQKGGKQEEKAHTPAQRRDRN